MNSECFPKIYRRRRTRQDVRCRTKRRGLINTRFKSETQKSYVRIEGIGNELKSVGRNIFGMSVGARVVVVV